MPTFYSRFVTKASELVKRSDYLYLVSRLLVGGVFLYASLDKITSPLDFAAAVDNYRLLPPAFSALLALTLPWLEAVAGICLILGIFPRAAAYIILVMLLVFAGALGSALFRGLDIGCGCFDLQHKTATSREIINYVLRDIVLIFFCGQIIISLSRRFSLSSLLPSSVRPWAE